MKGFNIILENREKIFICGNFGYKNNQIDGQTVKTRQLKDFLLRKLGVNNITYADTSFAKSKPFTTFRKIRGYIRHCSTCLILPGKNGLRILLPFYIRWKRNLRINVRYIVIGGWLYDFLKRNKYYLNLCKQLDGIYVETDSMKEKLTSIGLNNVFVLHNFRQIDFKIKIINEIKKPMKLVFFSRVVREKGIELAIEAVTNINRNENVISLDIYGPIENKYIETFREKLLYVKSNISYKGIIEPIDNNIYEELSKYDLMIFPTYYNGEGFPGAILDSFISGVPVLASNWKYNSEIVEENKTGKLFISQDLTDLVDKLRFLIENPKLIYQMKKNCLEEAKKYDADLVIDSLLKNMLIDK